MNTQRRTAGPAVSDLYIRVHMPLRVNPVNGCPLLPLTVVDHTRAERLVKEGRVDQRREQQLFMEHILGAVSACDISVHTNTSNSNSPVHLRFSSSHAILDRLKSKSSILGSHLPA